MLEDLKKIFKTAIGPGVHLPGQRHRRAGRRRSPTRCRPGDRVLAARFGMFSHLWIDMAQRLGLEVDVLDAEWGEGAPVERYQRGAGAPTRRTRSRRCSFTHNETATGVTSDVAGVRKALDDARHPGAAHGRRRELDRQHRLPDGRVGRGPRRHRLAEGPHAAGRPRHRLRQPEGARRSTIRPSCRACFFDFGDMRKANATGYFPYTPSLPMLYGLRESLAMLLEEGLENVFARHHRLAEGTRAAVKAWGLELCARAPKWNSDTVSAIMVPAGRQRRRGDRHRLPPLQPRARRRAGADGRASCSASATSATSTSCMLLGGIAGAEMAMRDVGIKVDAGQRRRARRRSTGGARADAAGEARPAAARARRAAGRAPAKEKATAGAAR